MIVWPAKDPNEVLDYAWVVPLDHGDTIDTFAASVASGAIVKDSESSTLTEGIVWLSGGVADELSYVSLTAVTLLGRRFRETAALPVLDRAAAILAAFRLRYPAFAAVEDGQIGFWLADAGKAVDSSWPAAIRDDARCAWAAHKMSETGLASGGIPAGVSSFKSGTFSATIADGIAGLKGLSATVYGREFMAMRRAAFGGPRLAWTPTDA